MKFLKASILLLFFAGCQKDENSYPKYVLWENSIPSQHVFNTLYDPIIYYDKVIIPDQDAGILICLNKTSGKELWQWNDATLEYGDQADGFSGRSYIYDGIFVTGDRNLTYGIDVKTGETVWHHRRELNSAPYITGVGSKFVNREWIFNSKIWINVGDVYTGEVRSIFEFERDDEHEISGNLPLLFEYDGEEFLTFSKIKFGQNSNNEYFSYQWLHLYNLTEDKLEWISDTIPLEHNLSGTAGLRPVFEDGQILLANDAIYSYNIEDGSLEWRKYYGNSFVLGTHLSAANGRVYGNNASGYMVCLNVHTGGEYFNVQTGSSASRIEISNDKVYITALTANDGDFMEVRDAKFGNILRRIRAPYDTGSNDRFFDDVITVDPETGYIYTADHELILCIDPEV